MRSLKTVSSFGLGLALAFVAPSVVRADDKKPAAAPTPDPKAVAKEKAVKAAKEELEKDCKSKKIEVPPVLGFFDKLVEQVGLDVSAAKDLTKKVIAKKVPWDVVATASDEKIRDAVDQKTSKIDAKKFTSEFGKWLSEWKPEKKDAKAEPAKPETPKK